MKIMEKLPGITNSQTIYRNLSYDEIFEHEKKNGDTELTNRGVMSVKTGIYTGRSPKDKYFVENIESRDRIWKGGNKLVSEEIFNELHQKTLNYLGNKPLYVFDGYVGARKSNRMSLRVITEKAWQHHFCKNMFISATEEELENFQPSFTILNAAFMKNPDYKKHNLNSDIFVMFNLEKKLAIIGGTEYGGEMKKGIFSVMNYYKPLENILTMHCSANQGREKHDSALFFGLSGTGKTTLSTDPNRPLIGDDEHAWDSEGIWNLEGGCYAKVINLNPDDEPEIFAAIKKNALLENVVINSQGVVDYTDNSITENTRVSYPITHIQNRIESSIGDHPKNIIFLACDAFGVLPPVAKLSSGQAMYHFLSGYTAKIAGTERGIKDPQVTFSACFGAAFMTLHPTEYAKLLGENIEKYNVHAYLVNTGWSGGPYGVGSRMKIKLTRKIIDGIFDGTLDHTDYTLDPILNLNIPNHLGEYGPSILHPWESWQNKADYEVQRLKLASMFVENFKQYSDEGKEFDFTIYGPKIS